MTTRDEVQLIKCSGGAGSSGQSFKNNVAGAASGVKMTDYEFQDWNWDTGLPSPPDSGVRYDSGHVFSMSGTISENAKASNVLRQGTNLGIVLADYVEQGNGDSVNVTADAVSSSAMSASVEVISQVNPGAFPISPTTCQGDAFYWYGSPSQSDHTSPPSNTDPTQAHFEASLAVGLGTPDGNYVDFAWSMEILNVNAGTGLFNSDPTPASMSARMNNRGLSLSDFDFEWHALADYSDAPVSSASSFIWDQPNTGDDVTFYLRFRFQGGAWQNHGAVTFTDSRPAV